MSNPLSLSSLLLNPTEDGTLAQLFAFFIERCRAMATWLVRFVHAMICSEAHGTGLWSFCIIVSACARHLGIRAGPVRGVACVRIADDPRSQGPTNRGLAVSSFQGCLRRIPNELQAGFGESQGEDRMNPATLIWGQILLVGWLRGLLLADWR